MWQKSVLYLDYNASAGISPEVREELIASLKDSHRWHANPSSTHQSGQREDAAGRDALSRIGRSLGVSDPSGFLLTSSGSEANQQALAVLARRCEVLLVGAGEHPASTDCIPSLRERFPALRVLEVPLRSQGDSDWDSLSGSLAHLKAEGVTRIGVSLAWVNHETGVILDLPQLRAVLGASGLDASIHLDAAQAWGKLPLDLPECPADLVSFSSHKIGAPAGAGLLWVRKGTAFHPLLPGSGQGGRRAGSLNLLALQSMGIAARSLDPEAFHARTHPVRERFERELQSRIPGVRIFGSEVPRVGNTSRFGFTGFPRAADWMENLDLLGFAVSRGSACKSGVAEPSQVLLRMGVPSELALHSLRVSFGPGVDWADLERFLEALSSLHAKKRMAL